MASVSVRDRGYQLSSFTPSWRRNRHVFDLVEHSYHRL